MKLKDFFRAMAGPDVYPDDESIISSNGEEWAGNILDAETTIIYDAGPQSDFTVAEIEGYGFIVNDTIGNSFFETIEDVEAAFPGWRARK